MTAHSLGSATAFINPFLSGLSGYSRIFLGVGR
jgi:hypothetical protein